VVGQDGVILRSVDARGWVVVTPVVSVDLFGVAYAGAILAVGEAGTLLMSVDNGVTWEPKSSGTTEDLFDVTSDLGIYTIVGANDTIIIGQLLTLEKESYIHEGIITSASQANTGTMADSAVSSFEAVDGTGDIQYEFVTESVLGADLQLEVSSEYGHAVSELVDFLSSLAAGQELVGGVSEQFTFYDWAALKATINVVESFISTDALRTSETTKVAEDLSFLEEIVVGGKYQQNVLQSLQAKE
ncbi:MAG: hypothetical protein WC476_13340, partial [Phycisphaerae bacterium]